jgi:hypothetical protein
MVRPPRIAVLVPNFLGVTRAVLGGIGQYTREHNPWIIVNNPWEIAERGLEPPRQSIDGAILCFPDILRNRRGRRIPAVLLTERFVDAPLPRVIADSAAIGRLAAAWRPNTCWIAACGTWRLSGTRARGLHIVAAPALCRRPSTRVGPATSLGRTMRTTSSPARLSAGGSRACPNRWA